MNRVCLQKFRILRRAALLAAVAALLADAKPTTAQTTWHVDDDCVPPGSGREGDPFCTIQQGVDAAFDGDTVVVAPGTYVGEGNRDISLYGKAITLKSSAGAAETILDIQGSPSSIHRGLFLIHGEMPETIIEGFTIKNGYLIGDTGGVGTGTPGGGGAAIMIRDSSPTIRACILTDNVSERIGNPFIADGLGGAVYVDNGSSAIFEACVVSYNHSGNRGGGLYIGFEESAVTIRNCLIVRNTSADYFPGAGVYNTFGNTTIINTAIVNNANNNFGGGFYNENGETFLRNCIVWGNEAAVGAQIYNDQYSELAVEYSNVAKGVAGVAGNGVLSWGIGNVDVDPLLFGPEKDNFHLLHGSPCIDTGNNLALPEDVLTDLGGDTRYLDDPDSVDLGKPDGIRPPVDMGPYEYDPNDCNINDTPDAKDLAEGMSQDCNVNSVPDECEVDCNENGQQDDCDLASGSSKDCNANDLPDECEADCNGNGQPDDCDVSRGFSDDCNANTVPDECETDCNGSGQPDDCDTASGFSEDCNENTVPDECELLDCNANDQMDSCDIAQGVSVDCGGDGVPDECGSDCNNNNQADDCDSATGFSEDCNNNLVPDECEDGGPTIVSSPQNQQVEAGDFAFFQLQAEGILLDYQWRKDGVALSNSDRISGSSSPTLVIYPVQTCDAGSYDCVVMDFIDFICRRSNPAILMVIAPCPADLDADSTTNAYDLALLLGAWGPNPDHPADLTGDGAVNADDLALLLGSWGLCE